MLDDFFLRALVASIGLALISGPVGCFVVWRRMAYFGDTIAHGGLLGVVLALSFQISVTAGIFTIAILIAIALFSLQKQQLVAGDTLLGILSHSTLAIGLVALSFATNLRFDINGFLFGDILAVSRSDILVIWIGGALVGIALGFLWRQLLAISVSRDIALAEGVNVQRTEAIFLLMIAAIIAIAIKVVGVLLITALLIIPAATARRFSRSPEHMAILAIVISLVAVLLGLNASLLFDTPAGPSIVVAMFLLFVGSLVFKQR